MTHVITLPSWPVYLENGFDIVDLSCLNQTSLQSVPWVKRIQQLVKIPLSRGGFDGKIEGREGPAESANNGKVEHSRV